MNSLSFLESFGFLPFRRRGKRGIKPHLSLRFNSEGLVDFHIDSSRGFSSEGCEAYNLITHAHLDHYGKDNIGNESAIASIETAKFLSVITGKEFRGRSFDIGEKLELGGIRVRTYPTKHIFGSTAFLIESDCKILVTGDVKDFTSLPKCDVLVAEATYGNADFIFEDEVERLIENAENSTFGVYPIGKAQKTAKILIENGYTVKASKEISMLCKTFGIPVSDVGEVNLISPRNLGGIKGKKYILTAQRFYKWPRIVISDHLDFLGLLAMIDHCDPEHVIFYHGRPSMDLLELLEGDCSLLRDLDVMSELEKIFK
jgi:putative mRNA 3-end processing factor